jgi:magnesium chelatase subunit D
MAPTDFGGVNLRAAPGPVREAWLEQLDELLGDTPRARIPLHITEARLLGGIDLAATLAAGKPIAERGLLACCDGGLATLAMAERAQRQVVAHLCTALDHGQIRMERDGLRQIQDARLAVVALDEGLPDESVHSALAERLAFHLDMHALSIRDVGDVKYDRHAIAAARKRYAALTLHTDQQHALATASLALGIDSPRAWLMTARAARGLTALAQRDAVSERDLAMAMQLCLAHRATQLPQSDAPDEPAPPPPDTSTEQNERDSTSSGEQEPLPDQLLEATVASIPEALLARLQSDLRGSGKTQAGKAGALQRQKLRGRPIGSQPGDPRRGGRLSVIDTLRAAVPWQRLRQQQRQGSGPAIDIRKEDFRLLRFSHRSESTTLFVVDASGSAALHRLAEAKGAVELLLADCYVRRDEVALIAFRGESAELLLPPTRSLLRAKRSLAGLPGGGGTPLASAIEMADQLAEQIQRRGATAGLVFLTDGVANISRDGTRGRESAAEDALKAARMLRERGVKSIVIDTSPRAQDRARRLAEALDAAYLAMPHADATRLKQAVEHSVASGS